MENFSLTTNSNPVETPSTPVMTSDEDSRFIVDLTTRTTSYCSMTANTPESRATLYNAMNNPEKHIKDCINEVISIKDVYVEVVQLHNEETGEVSVAPRTVIIDENGVGYQAVSLGVFSALKKMFQVYGEPTTWENPVKVKVRQISRSANKNILTFDIIL